MVAANMVANVARRLRANIVVSCARRRQGRSVSNSRISERLNPRGTCGTSGARSTARGRQTGDAEAWLRPGRRSGAALGNRHGPGECQGAQATRPSRCGDGLRQSRICCPLQGRRAMQGMTSRGKWPAVSRAPNSGTAASSTGITMAASSTSRGVYPSEVEGAPVGMTDDGL